MLRSSSEMADDGRADGLFSTRRYALSLRFNIATAHPPAAAASCELNSVYLERAISWIDPQTINDQEATALHSFAHEYE